MKNTLYVIVSDKDTDGLVGAALFEKLRVLDSSLTNAAMHLYHGDTVSRIDLYKAVQLFHSIAAQNLTFVFIDGLADLNQHQSKVKEISEAIRLSMLHMGEDYVKRVTMNMEIYDHHKTSKVKGEELCIWFRQTPLSFKAGTDFVCVHQDRCAAQLVWDSTVSNKDLERVRQNNIWVTLANDYDLWQHRYAPISYALNAAVYTLEGTQEQKVKALLKEMCLSENLEHKDTAAWCQNFLAGEYKAAYRFLYTGLTLHKQNQKNAQERLKLVHKIEFIELGTTILAVPSSDLQNDVAHMLLDEYGATYPVVGVYYPNFNKDAWKFSLRGVQGSDAITAEEIAKFFGGGGHDLAAGCLIPWVDGEPLQWPEEILVSKLED